MKLFAFSSIVKPKTLNLKTLNLKKHTQQNLSDKCVNILQKKFDIRNLCNTDSRCKVYSPTTKFNLQNFALTKFKTIWHQTSFIRNRFAESNSFLIDKKLHDTGLNKMYTKKKEKNHKKRYLLQTMPQNTKERLKLNNHSLKLDLTSSTYTIFWVNLRM